MGAPVVPEVKVILTVPGGSATGVAGRRSCIRAWPATSTGDQGKPAMRAARSPLVSTVSTPAACSACCIWAGVKNSGSGTCTTPAARAASSSTTKAGPLSSTVASTRVPRACSWAAACWTAAAKSAADHAIVAVEECHAHDSALRCARRCSASSMWPASTTGRWS